MSAGILVKALKETPPARIHPIEVILRVLLACGFLGVLIPVLLLGGCILYAIGYALLH